MPTLTPMTLQRATAILDLTFHSRDLQQRLTIRAYLGSLLRTVWEQGEAFSGKRPFGNSGWKQDLALALVKAGQVPGTVDRDGYLETCDDTAVDTLIHAAIDVLFPGTVTPRAR